jgi:flagellar basal-body rod modification protein FlgD
VIADAAGRAVRRLETAHLPAGSHALAWDGRDDRGRALPAGSYYVRVRGETGEASAAWVQVR